MEKVSILMIDDQEDFLEPMSFWLRSKGYETRVVTSGRAGVDEVQTNPPDVVFLDIFMPEMNGIETLRRIREINKDVPVIMLTAAVVQNIKDAYSMEELNSLGVSGFFKKNDSFEELAKVLDITLKIHKRFKKAG